MDNSTKKPIIGTIVSTETIRIGNYLHLVTPDVKWYTEMLEDLLRPKNEAIY